MFCPHLGQMERGVAQVYEFREHRSIPKPFPYAFACRSLEISIASLADGRPATEGKISANCLNLHVFVMS